MPWASRSPLGRGTVVSSVGRSDGVAGARPLETPSRTTVPSGATVPPIGDCHTTVPARARLSTTLTSDCRFVPRSATQRLLLLHAAHVGDRRPRPGQEGGRALGATSGNGMGSIPSSAAVMNCRKMRAGMLPPVSPGIGMRPSGWPIHTAVDSTGV